MCPAQQIKQRARVLTAVVEQLAGAQVDVLELCLAGEPRSPPYPFARDPKFSVFCL